MPYSKILSIKYEVLRWCHFVGQGLLRVLGIVVYFWAKVGMTAPSEWKCVFKIKRQFCFLFNLLPESWVQFFIFPGQLAQIMWKKNKIFLILDGGDPDFTIKAFLNFILFFIFCLWQAAAFCRCPIIIFWTAFLVIWLWTATLFWRVA